MRKAARPLLYASRALAICAVLAGLAMGLIGMMAIGFTCFDSCPSPEQFFPRLLPEAVFVLKPCVALEALALAFFLVYCAITRQPRRAVVVILILLGVGLTGLAVINALIQQAQATLPINSDGLLEEGPVAAWGRLWALALEIIAGVWSGALVVLQWGAEWSLRDPASRMR
jgi:hypothetical protein